MDPTARRLVDLATALLVEEHPDVVLRRLMRATREVTGARRVSVRLRRDGHRPPPLRAGLAVPIAVDGDAYGELLLRDRADGQAFTAVDEERAHLLAEHAAVALRHARRTEELGERLEQLGRTEAALRATAEISRALADETDLDAVLELVAERARALMSVETVAIVLPYGGALRVAEVSGAAPKWLKGHAYPASGSLVQEVFTTGRPRRLDEPAARRGFERGPLARAGLRPESGLFVPLGFRGRNVGVVVALDRRDGRFSREDEDLLSAFAVTAAAAVATAQTVTAERLRERQAAAEAERRRWARDLHDQTLQGLAAIRVSLVGAQVGPESELREAVDAGVAALQVELEGLREIIHDVRPSSLDDLGLGAAIEALVARHAGAGPELHLDVDLECESRPEPVRLEAEIETELYRITQEALVNALKHAHAQRVDIVVAEFEDEVGVRVRDDGIGFAPGTPTGGVGLVGMRERVELLAGRLTITSRPDGGTTVEARVPARYRAQDPRLPAR